MVETVKKLFARYRQFILFCVVGAMNTLITMGVLWLLNKQLGVMHLIASPIAYGCGVVNGYLWSSKMVFETRRTPKNGLKFVVVNLFVMGVNTLLMYLWVDIVGIDPMISQVITIAFTMVLNFTLNKLWTFREQRSK